MLRRLTNLVSVSLLLVAQATPAMAQGGTRSQADAAAVSHEVASSPSGVRHLGASIFAPAPSPIPADRATPSLLSERIVAGWLAGVGFALVAVAASDNDDVTVLAFTAGSAAGVLLATARREGARPLTTLVGSALGGVLLFAVVDAVSGPGSFVLILPASVLPPLGGALAHSL